jgi:hypothetical protein
MARCLFLAVGLLHARPEGTPENKNEQESYMKRDPKLLFSILMLLIFTVAGAFQSWIVIVYYYSALNQNWSYFSELFPSAVHQPAPGALCMGDCSPNLPFVAGWIGIASFVTALIVLTYSWWRSKSPASGKRLHKGGFD